MFKRIVLVAAVVASFLIGFGAPAEAGPVISDRARWYGYFKNQYDDPGKLVIPGGFPAWVNNANNFIFFLKCKWQRGVPTSPTSCKGGGDDHGVVAASFIMDTMLSNPPSYVRNLPTTSAQEADWENRVRAAAAAGRVTWDVVANFTENTYYQDDVGGSPRGDIAGYYESGSEHTIVFRNAAGAIVYMIRRPCANPLGTLRGLPVANNFDARPSATADVSQAQQGDTIHFNYTIFNTGPTATTPITCQIVGAQQPAGYVPLPQQDANRGPAVPTATICPVTIGPGGTVQVALETVVVGNLPPGNKICRSLVINPRNAAGGTFRASAETCVTIAKSPYVHFLGNDVWAGGNFADINPACNGASKIRTVARQMTDGSVAGSISEYGAFALGTVTGFGSASKALLSPASATGKDMTFANTGAPAVLGQYGASQHCINDFLARFSNVGVSALGASVDVDGRGSGMWRITGNHSFHGNLGNGKLQVYIVQDGSVTIDGPLKYSGSYADLGQVPSLVIITTCTTPSNCANPAGGQGHIKVNASVTQMDGLFIAKNTFNTCADVADPLNVNTCNQQLTVNGAVIARQLMLRRTFGADGATPTQRKTPAEVFNFSSEVYIRSALQQSSQATIEAVDTHELPPRF